jgi:chromate transporter
MNDSSASTALIAHLALLSVISFGGVPAALPDLRDFVVGTNGWLTDRDFANYFAVVQAIPGPNMILMMSFIGWKVGGLPTAIAGALATFGPSCALAFTGFRVWERFRDTRWQPMVRRGLVPVTIGLVIAGGYVMALAGEPGWTSFAVTFTAAALLLLAPRINPLWLLGAGAALGGLGVL